MLIKCLIKIKIKLDFCLFCFVLVSAHTCTGQHSPVGHRVNKNNGNKKDVGVSLSRAYPYSQALALPLDEDKQRQACPRQ